MRILWLSNGSTPNDIRFLEKLVERGHEPLFLCYNPGEKVKIKGVKTTHVPLLVGWSNRRRFHWLNRIYILKHMRKVIREFKPDILHSGYIRFHGYYGALSEFHPTLSMPFGSDVLIRPDKSDYDMKIVRYTLQQADMITCNCEVIKKRIREISGCSSEKIVLFPWGIDLKNYRPFDNGIMLRSKLGWDDKDVLIMNRRFQPVYGIEYFLDALPVVVQSCPDVRIFMIGDGPLRKEMECKVTELGLDDYTYFTGSVDDQKMAEYLNASDIYVTTSLSDGTSASMLEAMACGIPVIVSDAPVYFEWVEDGTNGFMVERKNVNKISSTLIKLVRNKYLQRKMGQCNLKIAQERADWECNFDVLENIYADLVRA